MYRFIGMPFSMRLPLLTGAISALALGIGSTPAIATIPHHSPSDHSLSPFIQNHPTLAQQINSEPSLPTGSDTDFSPLDPLPPSPPAPITPPAVPTDPILPSDPDTPPPDAVDEDPASTGPLIPVQSIQVLGSSVYDEGDFDPIITPLEGQSVTRNQLQQAADAITQLYLNDAYLTSRAVLVTQDIVDGQVTIQVVEGRVSEIEVAGNQRLRDRYIRRRIALGTNVPLRTDQLEDQLRLLRADPLIENVEASLRRGEGLGESIVIVRVTEADPLFGSVGVDNYSPLSVGSERTRLQLGHRNLSGRADTLSIDYNRTTQGGSNVVDVNYRVPFNPMEGTVQFRTLLERNRVIQEPFDAFEIKGESERYEVTVRQPIVRSPREELAFSLGFSYRDGQTLAFGFDPPIPLGLGADDGGDTRTSVFRVGQDYVRRDVQGAWALRSQFNIGTGLFNATVNDQTPDSEFFSWLGQAQRVQRVGTNHLLIFQLDTQLTNNALLSSEQFVIGGGRSVRGFRQNARAGDNGIRFSIEDRFTVARNEAGGPKVQLIPFFDIGTVWNDDANTDLPDQRLLSGLGLGLFWQMLPNLDVRLDLAIPLIDLDDRSTNAQDDGIYFNVNYRL